MQLHVMAAQERALYACQCQFSRRRRRDKMRGAKKGPHRNSLPPSIAVTHSLRRPPAMSVRPVGIVIRSPILLLLRSSASACALLCCASSQWARFLKTAARRRFIHFFCWRRNGRWMNAVVRRPLRRHPRRENSLPLDLLVHPRVSYPRRSLPSTTRRLKPTTVMRSSSMR